MLMKKLIVANWKMNPKTAEKAEVLFREARKVKKEAIEAVICSPFSFLYLGRGITLGAQDCFWEREGAFTGEVSPAMLKSAGVKYVLVGHSERRRNLGETDEMVNKKIKAVLKEGLYPILCVGSEERGQDGEFRKIKNQLKKSLSGIKKAGLKKLVIAYEPIWAISTTKGRVNATPGRAGEGGNFIRKILIGLFDKESAGKVRIIYGGSVDSNNIRGFLKGGGMAGALVGAASLEAGEFGRIIRAAL